MAAINAHTPVSGPSPTTSDLALAKSLYDVLACGHESLAYNVAGTFALWTRGPGGRWRPAPGAETVPAGEWRPCVELLPDGTTRPRRLNPWVIAGHLRGRYSVAPQAPSWAGAIAFDIDAHVARDVLGDAGGEVIPHAAVRRALADRDGVLAELLRALDCGPGREPVILSSPGQGFHVYLPLTRGPLSPDEHTWPARWIVDWVSEILRRRGVTLADGRLELYPAGRPLRAPCGRGSLLLHATRPDQPEDLGLVPVPGTSTTRRWARHGERGIEVIRRPVAMVQAFLARWEAARRPLDAWLGEPRAAWSPVVGPFATEAPTRSQLPRIAKKEDGQRAGNCVDPRIRRSPGRPSGPRGDHEGRAVRDRGRIGQGGISNLNDNFTASPAVVRSPDVTSPRSGVLRRGKVFRAHLAQLLRFGVTSLGTRHDAVLSLVFGWHVDGKGEAEIRAELEHWASAHPHVSRLKGIRFVRQCVREGMHYYHRIKMLPQRARGRTFAAALARMRELAPADFLVLAKVAPEVREEAWAILEYLHGHADVDGAVAEPVSLGRAQLDALVTGDRRVVIDGQRHRAEVLAVRELERLGVVTLYCDYSRGRHGRVFVCWYTFGTGVLAMPREPGTWAAPQTRSPARSGANREPVVVAARRVREGVVRVLSDGARGHPWVELTPRPDVIEEPGRRAWWRTMYEGRRFTLRELRDADESVVRAGPWGERSEAPSIVLRASASDRPYGVLPPEELDPYGIEPELWALGEAA